MRTSIWLVRHGQTALNKERRYQSHSPASLTPYGQQQAQALAQRLRRIPFGQAVASPAPRTLATAQAALGGRSTPIAPDPRWAESDHGQWEGLTYREVQARFPADAAARFADPLHGRPLGGESLAEVRDRVMMAWAELAQAQGGRFLVVTHATPIQLVLCALCQQPPTLHWRWRIDLGSVTAIDLYGETPIIRMVNEVPRVR